MNVNKAMYWITRNTYQSPCIHFASGPATAFRGSCRSPPSRVGFRRRHPPHGPVRLLLLSSTGGVTSRLVFVRQFARTDRRGNLEPFKRCPTPDFSPAGVGRSRARRERRYTRNRIRSNLLEEENPRQNLFRNVFKTRCVDFAKAFDTVSHNKLMHKLSCYGISGSLLHWIESFLSCRTQQTHVGKLPVVHFTYM